MKIDMDPVEKERKINELKIELERIIAGYREVEQHIIPEEAEYVKNVEEIKRQRLVSLSYTKISLHLKYLKF